MSSSVQTDNKRKDILILGEGSTKRIRWYHINRLTAEGKYAINFTQLRKIFVLSIHYDGSNNLLLANTTKSNKHIYFLHNRSVAKRLKYWFYIR